jgi:OPA family glycerol-3-phosphate transporter-like MFS transporter
MFASFPAWLGELLPIVLLLAAVAFVVARLPRADLGHSREFLRRRRLNWLPLGLTYAFLYMGRYNLNAAKNALGAQMTKDDFASIFALGALVYGCSFVINGPLTDRWGGRKTILIAAAGAAACNAAMGLVLALDRTAHLFVPYSILYAANMYFQSFGAVSIVKVNAHWFHVRERGTFGGIFGVLISLGLYFAFDWSRFVIERSSVMWAFFVPAIILVVFLVLDALFVFDSPSETGHPDFALGDDSLAGAGESLALVEVVKRLLTHPILVTIALIEFCSGYFRQAVMQWTPIFAKETGSSGEFVHQHWGMMLCIAGILGGVVAGAVSDHVFQSRRGPSAVLMYAVMLAASIACVAMLASPLVGYVLVIMSMCVIGVHGLLSGTASMDFAGKRNTGLAVGIIDGFVYLGSSLQAVVIGAVLPADGTPASADPASWIRWPVVIVPSAALGLLLCVRLWSARPQAAGAREH